MVKVAANTKNKSEWNASEEKQTWLQTMTIPDFARIQSDSPDIGGWTSWIMMCSYWSLEGHKKRRERYQVFPDLCDRCLQLATQAKAKEVSYNQINITFQ